MGLLYLYLYLLPVFFGFMGGSYEYVDQTRALTVPRILL